MKNLNKNMKRKANESKEEKIEKASVHRWSRYILSGIGLIVLVGAVIFVTHSSFQDHSPQRSEQPITQNKTLRKEEDISFKDLDLLAEAVYVYDALGESVLYSKNPTAQLPLGSITKTMLAVTASDIIPANENIKITKKDIKMEGDTNLYVNESWNFNDLLDFTLLTSSNDGAQAIASVGQAILKNKGEDAPKNLKEMKAQQNVENVFVRQMNKKAQELGLEQTFFLNVTGLDINNQVSGGYGSAKDVATLFEHIIKNEPELLAPTTHPQLHFSSELRKHVAENTNEIARSIPGLIGSKTGYTDLAGGNLAIAFDAGLNHPVIAVVLDSTYEGRFKDMKKIVDTVLAGEEKHN